jgi:8-oxo-dGTP diphosphatase
MAVTIVAAPAMGRAERKNSAAPVPGEEAAGLQPELLSEPAAVAVRSFHPDWPVTLGLSYAAVVDVATPFVAEAGQPVAWMRLDEGWESYFPDDVARIRKHAAWMAGQMGRH